MTKDTYRIRYQMEAWNKPAPGETHQVIPGISEAAPGDPWGYTDTLFAVSVIRDRNGAVASVMIMDSDTGFPSKEMCELVINQITHYMVTHL